MATAAVTYTFTNGTLIKSAEANQNFTDLVSFLNNQVIHKDASVAFTAVPSGPATDPSAADQLVRKSYVDRLGIVARDPHTSNDALHNLSFDSDMVLTNVSVTAGRVYSVHLHSQYQLSGSGVWSIECYLNGASIGKFRHVTADATDTVDAMVWWLPSVTASTDDLLVHCTENSGTASFQLQASASEPRVLSLLDWGAL